MATRQKKTIVSGVTREAAEEAFAQYAKADASINKIQTEVELKCAQIREKWQDKLSALTVERGEAFDVLQGFAAEHPELFAKKKSLDMVHGTIGFRTGTPKLKTLKGFTWASALELVKSILPGYIREGEPTIAKDKLLADREADEVFINVGDGDTVSMAEAMKGCGLQVVQDETFYVEPKSE